MALRSCGRVLAALVAALLASEPFVARATQAAAPAPAAPGPQQPPPQQPAPQQPPPAYPPQAYPPPAYPPPGYGYPPPGYPGYATPYGPSFYSQAAYDQQKKDPFIALLLEFLIAGVGSIYADHVVGALITWALLIGGIVFVVVGVNKNADAFARDSDAGGTEIILGVLMILGGRIYGFIDAWSSVKEYNRKLRAKLGLPPFMSVGVVPFRTPTGLAVGPGLRFTF